MIALNEEIESLGLFAAVAELEAEAPQYKAWERRQLQDRAQHYRNLQIAALMAFAGKETSE